MPCWVSCVFAFVSELKITDMVDYFGWEVNINQIKLFMQHFLDPGPIIALTCHSFAIYSVSHLCFCKPSWCLQNICQSCFRDLPKLLHGFVKVVTCICQSWYMDLSSSYMYFLPKPDQAKVWPRFQRAVKDICLCCSAEQFLFCNEWKDCVIMKLKFERLVIG